MFSSHVDTSMTTLHEKSLKVTEKTPNLEDPYLEFCNSIWPHLCTVGKIFLLAKTFQKTPKSENAQKYHKNEFFVCTRLSLKETRVRTRLALYNTRVRMRVAIYNSHVRLMYMNFCIGILRMPPCVHDCCFCNPRTPPKNVKKHVFWISGSLGSYATDSFSFKYFVFTPNSSLSI